MKLMSSTLRAMVMWAASLPALVHACDAVGASERPRIERAADGHGVRISYRARVRAPILSVERMIADPSRFPLWLPSVRRATATPDGFVATYQLPWPFGPVEEVMRVQREEDRDGISFSWHQLSGGFLRDEACWRLHSVDATTTEVAYVADLQFRHWVPVMLLRRAERRALPRAAAALERWADRALARAPR